jgi:hypothetical protein
MAKGEKSDKGANKDVLEKADSPSEPAPSAKREYLDVWAEGKFRVKIGAAFPQPDGSLKVFLNALPVDKIITISNAKTNGNQTQQ